MYALWMPYEKGDFRSSDGLASLDSIIQSMKFSSARYMQSKVWTVVQLYSVNLPLFGKDSSVIIAADVWSCDFFFRMMRNGSNNEAETVADFIYGETWKPGNKSKDIAEYLKERGFLAFHYSKFDETMDTLASAT